MTWSARFTGVLDKKSIDSALADTREPGTRLRRALGPVDLTLFGVAVVIGAGLFSIAPYAAGNVSGPAVAVSFLIAAAACLLAGLCYTELAAAVPVAGSAYAFSYAGIGEVVAWLIGWDLLLEYALGAAVVATSWSDYLGQLLETIGLPSSLRSGLGPLTVDWGAVLVVAALTVVLVLGIRLSSRVNVMLTAAKLLVVVFVIGVGVFYIRLANYSPFFPPSAPRPGGDPGLSSSLLSLVLGQGANTFGPLGVLAGASLVFFAFIGFDAVSTAAEETRNPRTDLPRGILLSLGVVTLLYVLVSLVLVGLVPYGQLRGDDVTLATAFTARGLPWASFVIAIGAVAGLATVVLVLMLGQTRVLFAMSRDGMLPVQLARTGRYGTPAGTTLIIGVSCAVIAGLVPRGVIQEMTNIGTLFAFVLVAIATWRLRHTRADLRRPFRVPALPAIATAAILVCLWLMLDLSALTWVRFGVWMSIGVGLYLLYARRPSAVAARRARLRDEGGDTTGTEEAFRPSEGYELRGRLPTRRIRPYTSDNDLPPVRRAGWLGLFGLCAAAGVAWVVVARTAPQALVGAESGDAPIAVVRTVAGLVVPVALLVLATYALWRFQLERLAGRPGPVRVLPVTDLSERATTASPPVSPLAAKLAAELQAALVRTKIYGSTAIPSAGSSSDFLEVIETAGSAAQGPWGAVARLPRLFFPTHSYEVACRILPPAGGSDAADAAPCVLLVELTRLPNYQVAPVIIREWDWDRATERAAHWVAGVVLPRTRRCRTSPWTLWRGLRLPDGLFDLYQRFQRQRGDLEFDAAMASLREALLLDPANLALRLEMGKLQEQLGMHLDALATYDDIIERASRTDRALALLWHLPPGAETRPGPGRVEAESRDEAEYVDVAWHDEGRVPELGASHPVVYVARYRHMLLLGLGDRLADQWWRRPEEVCTDDAHLSAQDRRRDYARSTLSERFVDRYAWVHTDLRQRGMVRSERMPGYLDPRPRTELPTTGDERDREKVRRYRGRVMDAYVFFTSAAVASWELLERERGVGLQTPPAVRRVVPRRSLRLVASWTVLRAGLALACTGAACGREASPREAERSILYPRSAPCVLPGRVPESTGLFGAHWPPDRGVLFSDVKRVMRSPFRTLFSWHVHYNAACVFALALLEPPPRPADTADLEAPLFPAQARHSTGPDPATVRAAISELTKAVTCGNSAFIAAQREWLLTEDPDLDVLRGTAAFRNLEAAAFGSVRSAVQRGPRLVVWQQRTFVSGFVAHVASEVVRAGPSMLAGAERAQDAGDPVADLRRLVDAEERLWWLVEAIARDHRDSHSRHVAMVGFTELARTWGFAVPDLRHPQFLKDTLARQLAALKGEDEVHPLGPDAADLADGVDEVVAAMTERLLRTAQILRGPVGDACCSLARARVVDAESGELRALLADGADGADTVRRRLRSNLRRWAALHAYFDDRTLSGREVTSRATTFTELARPART